MDCEQVQQWIHPYLDGEMSRPKARAIRNHVNECSECMDRVIDYHGLDDVLEADEVPAVPDDFTEAVMNDVNKQASRDRLVSYGRTFGLVATLIAGIFLGSIMAVDVTRTMDENNAQTTGSVAVQATVPDDVDYRSETFTDPGDDSLADRFVRVESTGAGEQTESP